MSMHSWFSLISNKWQSFIYVNKLFISLSHGLCWTDGDCLFAWRRYTVILPQHLHSEWNKLLFYKMDHSEQGTTWRLLLYTTWNSFGEGHNLISIHTMSTIWGPTPPLLSYPSQCSFLVGKGKVSLCSSLLSWSGHEYVISWCSLQPLEQTILGLHSCWTVDKDGSYLSLCLSWQMWFFWMEPSCWPWGSIMFNKIY
jgi:hypothetical protein